MEVISISDVKNHLVFNIVYLSSAEWEKEKEQEYEDRQKRKEKKEKVGDIQGSIKINAKMFLNCRTLMKMEMVTKMKKTKSR